LIENDVVESLTVGRERESSGSGEGDRGSSGGESPARVGPVSGQRDAAALQIEGSLCLNKIARKSDGRRAQHGNRSCIASINGQRGDRDVGIDRAILAGVSVENHGVTASRSASTLPVISVGPIVGGAAPDPGE